MAVKNVIKRDGIIEEFDISKVDKQLEQSIFDLKKIDTKRIKKEIQNKLYDGIETEKIQQLLIQTAYSLIDVDTPDYTFLAGRLVLKDMYHKVGKIFGAKKGKPYSHSFKEYFDYGVSQNKLIPTLLDGYDLKRIENAIDIKRDMQFTYMGIKTLTDRYLQKNLNGDIFELPQYMFMAIAMFLFSKEIVAVDERTTLAIKLYDGLSRFKFMLATPTLTNARTNFPQLSSCFVNSIDDNIESIFDIYKENALHSKYGGGIGTDISRIRSAGSDIRGFKSASSGSVPFLKVMNDVALAVNQTGIRKGSINVTTEIWNKDILDFLALKENSGDERRRTHDLFTSVSLNSVFIERVSKNENFTLFSPDEVDLTEFYLDEFREKYLQYENDNSVSKEVVSARLVWNKLVNSYFENGSPFMFHKDESNRRNQNKHTGIVRSSNLCKEIIQVTDGGKYERQVVNGVETNVKVQENRTAVCNLASIDVYQINTKADLKEWIPILTRALDNVIDLNYYTTQSAKATNLNSRAIGLGIMGEHRYLATNGIEYGSQEHFNWLNQFMENFSFEVINQSSELAYMKGEYPEFRDSEWSKGVLPIDTYNSNVDKIVKNNLICDWVSLRKKIQKQGIRNGYLMAIAPTSSISNIVGTTSTIEPIYMRKWNEENLSGTVPNVVPNLNSESWYFYKSAYDIEQINLVKAGAVRQKYLDQSQSLNLFVNPENTDSNDVTKLLLASIHFGLKTNYYMRSKSSESNQEECLSCQ